jgi:pimeloyl-ACP methyl ester carboxylesterase
MSETMIHANGVDLCVETFGAATDPAILLVMGAAGSMDYWEDGFCERLAAEGRYVIRYDNRDTGRSPSYEPGDPAYTFTDLVADAAGLIEELGRSRTHVVGVSMGGAIAQTLAVERPERVASLVLISTSAIEGVDRDDLPPASNEVRAVFESPPPEPDWTDRAAVIDFLVEGELPFLGSVRGDDATKRDVAGRLYDRTTNVASSQTNHWILGGDPVQGGLAEVTAPTLVLHGTEDPLFPYEHGVALAAAIPGARLVPLDGVGHEVPPRQVWDVVVPAIVEHTGSAR